MTLKFPDTISHAAGKHLSHLQIQSFFILYSVTGRLYESFAYFFGYHLIWLPFLRVKLYFIYTQFLNLHLFCSRFFNTESHYAVKAWSELMILLDQPPK
jgi:hypothetical protein